jgi:ELWxxDGT repeat protein
VSSLSPRCGVLSTGALKTATAKGAKRGRQGRQGVPRSGEAALAIDEGGKRWLDMRLGRWLPLLLALSWPLAATAAAAPAYLVADLNTDSVADSDSSPLDFVTVGGVAYFVADDGLLGRELWRSDGTAEGTRLVADLNPGERDSSPRALTAIRDRLWFRAWDDRRGCGIWRSDGTTAGTQLVALVHDDLLACVRQDADGGQPTAFTALGTRVLFVADADDIGRELWRSDGTANGTVPVADLLPGDLGANPMALTVLNGVLYFYADDGEHGFELWCTNGISTRLVRDILPGEGSAIPSGLFTSPRGPDLTVAGDVLVFAAHDGEHGIELWRSDGTPGGTRLLLDAAPDTMLGGLRLGDVATPFTAVGGDAVFFSLDVEQPPLTLRAWRSDGTAAGTTVIGELPFTGIGQAPTGVAALGDAVYFTYPAAGVANLWRAADGTASVVRAFAGRRVGPPQVIGGQLLFLADDGDGCGLWRSDGTAAGTMPLRADAPAAASCPDGLTIPGTEAALGGFGARALLAAVDPGRGSELIVTDGSADGTRLVRDINDTRQRNAGSSIIFDGGALDDRLLFSAAAGPGLPIGLWRSDGSASGTELLAPISPVAGGGVVDGRFVFAAFDQQGAGLWSSDGTALGTRRARAIPPGAWGVTTTPAALFLTSSDDAGDELWRSDGTEQGTFRLADLSPGPASTSFGTRTPFAGGLAFVVQRIAGDELWFSDGSEAGTRRTTAFGGTHNRIPDLVEVNGVLYLDVAGLAPAGELWRSDGTEQGTARVVSLADEPAASVAWLAAGPSSLFFAAADPTAGLELWHSDGTADGTRRVRDIDPGEESGLIDPDGVLIERTARAGGRLLVVADDGSHGPEVWASDGSTGGTALLRDIDPRPPALVEDFALPLVEVGSLALFAPLDAETGIEPWISDGTTDGTRRIADIAPGARSSLAGSRTFAVTRTHVFMAADDGRTGSELWAIPRAALGGGPGCAGDCNGDFRVAIDELVRGVGIALGATPVGACASFDGNADGAVSIAELIGAVNAALAGC